MSNSDTSLDKNIANISVEEKASASDVSSHGFTPREQKRIMWKVDRRLIATTGLIYCISLMDRTNVASAAIAGMNTELNITTGNGYSIISLVFFVSYIVFQPFGTVAVRKFGPRAFLTLTCLLWGATMIGMGFVKEWQTMAGLRVLLGVFEAAYFPAIVYLLSTWYTRYEIGKRYAVFYSLGCVASAFSGILAFGLMQMNGLAGLEGWSWIFIMEGIITCLIAAFAYLFLVPFPDAKADLASTFGFLKQSEVDFIVQKVNNDRGDVEPEPFNLVQFLRGGLDLKIWCFALITLCNTTVTYALSFFLPLILRNGMGFSVGASQCLVAPPYAVTGIWMYVCGWFGDKYRLRAPVIVFNNLLMLLGLGLMGFATNVGVRYFGVFVVCASGNSGLPAILSYQANNIRGQWKRALASSTLIGSAAIGGIIGSLVFRTQDSPSYHPGLYACIAAAVLSILLSTGLSLYFMRANRKAAKGEKSIEGANFDFRYTY